VQYKAASQWGRQVLWCQYSRCSRRSLWMSGTRVKDQGLWKLAPLARALLAGVNAVASQW
jgi:hypothetical protein